MDPEPGREGSGDAGIWAPPVEAGGGDGPMSRAAARLARPLAPFRPVGRLVVGLVWLALGVDSLRRLLTGGHGSDWSWGDWTHAALPVVAGLAWLGLWRGERRRLRTDQDPGRRA